MRLNKDCSIRGLGGCLEFASLTIVVCVISTVSSMLLCEDDDEDQLLQLEQLTS